jgi:diguanylate cyclase with GGDEF domain
VGSRSCSMMNVTEREQRLHTPSNRTMASRCWVIRHVRAATRQKPAASQCPCIRDPLESMWTATRSARALQEFAKRVAKVLRATDVLARLVDDEFAVLADGHRDRGCGEARVAKIVESLMSR